MSTITTQLVLAQQYMTRYGMTTYVILGNIGLIFNIAIFSRPHQRGSSCILYLLTASICAFLGLNISAIPIIYQLDHVSAAMASELYCLLQYYFRQTFNLLMRIFFLLACADRYAISSETARIRSFSQYKVAIRLIPSIIIGFFLLSILPTMLRAVENGKCDSRSGINTVIYSIYVLTIVGILPLGSAITFSVLLGYNLKKIRSRVQPMNPNTNPATNQVLRKRDRDMLRMLLIEILFYLITTVPTVAMLIYGAVTQTTVKNDTRQRIEAFIRYNTGIFILFASNSMSFWIYICASRSFRLEVKDLLIKCYRFVTWKKILVNEIK